MGFGVPSVLPRTRWALTPPFHHRRRQRRLGRLFSVPLSVASRRPAVSRHPALRSPDFPPGKQVPRRLSGQLRPSILPPVDTQRMDGVPDRHGRAKLPAPAASRRSGGENIQPILVAPFPRAREIKGAVGDHRSQPVGRDAESADPAFPGANPGIRRVASPPPRRRASAPARRRRRHTAAAPSRRLSPA